MKSGAKNFFVVNMKMQLPQKYFWSIDLWLCVRGDVKLTWASSVLILWNIIYSHLDYNSMIIILWEQFSFFLPQFFFFSPFCSIFLVKREIFSLCHVEKYKNMKNAGNKCKFSSLLNILSSSSSRVCYFSTAQMHEWNSFIIWWCNSQYAREKIHVRIKFNFLA